MTRNETDERLGAYRRIWLHLVKEGGWHSCREVFQFVPVATANRSGLLAHMTGAGYIAKRDTDREKCVYGVTKECRVPRFVSVGDVASAFGG